jgi:hypothetical protein
MVAAHRLSHDHDGVLLRHPLLEIGARMLEYYLCFCEGGFEERQLGDVQILLTKPRSRRAPIATIHAART